MPRRAPSPARPREAPAHDEPSYLAGVEGARSRRSVHVVPGSSERFLAKAAQLDADQLVLDLEDAVSPDDKDRARGLVVDAVRATRRGREDPLRTGQCDGQPPLPPGPHRARRRRGCAARDGHAAQGPDDRGHRVRRPPALTARAGLRARARAPSASTSRSRTRPASCTARRSPRHRGWRPCTSVPATSAQRSGSRRPRSAGRPRATPATTSTTSTRGSSSRRARRASRRSTARTATSATTRACAPGRASCGRSATTASGRSTPVRSPTINEIFTPTDAEIARADALLAAYGSATTGAARFEGEMVDEASRKMAERVVRAGRAAGRVPPSD